jgi:hypothetical protein
MGTRGLYVFKYISIYYIFYNHWDSYPESGLGDAIYQEIKNLDWNQIKEKIKKISIDDINYKGKNFEGLKKAVDNVKNYSLIDITKNEPTLHMKYDVSFIYIIDLDNNTFRIRYSTD